MAKYNNILKIEGKRGSGELISGVFSSVCDAISVSLSARSAADATVKVVGYTAEREEVTVYEESFSSGDISLEYTFDPISLAVYARTESFAVKIVSEGEITLEELSADEEINDVGEEYCDTRDNTGISADSSPIVYVTSSGGERIEVPRVPSHVLFVGNSLVFGMGKRYGMCASSPDKDYFHYVSETIKKYNPVCKFDKLYGSMFEHAESLSAFDTWYNTDCAVDPARPIPAKDAFSPDLDLILLQLGDNINTDEKLATFLVTGDILIEKIKEACPRARIIWVHGWYNRARTSPPIRELCERWGLERIDIGAIRSHATEAHSQKYYFDMNEGCEREVSERWITHPGNLGMKKIADKIIEKLKLEHTPQA
ncbi:MAG: hypothetical protein IJD79_00175 [Clostridia bacterium]|nr:hypothetical protein [Clostridia bacterium]